MGKLTKKQKRLFNSIPDLPEYAECMKLKFLKISKDYLEISNLFPDHKEDEYRIKLVALYIESNAQQVYELSKGKSTGIVNEKLLADICELLARIVVGEESEYEKLEKKGTPKNCETLLKDYEKDIQ